MNKKWGKRKRCISEAVLDSIWKETFSKIYFFPFQKHEDVRASKEDLKHFQNFLKEKKEELNNTKSKLNALDIIKWRNHTTNMHVCGLVPSFLRNEIKAELITQAWAKFCTILNSFSLIKINDATREFKSAHLCEAPGAFVTSLNHFLKSRYDDNLKWSWVATTLNPYYEGNTVDAMVSDDRLIIETLNNWDFHQDYTGNIMSSTNFRNFKEKHQNIDLVTADGSIDCSEEPDKQEEFVAPLFFWEILTALHILSDGGSFVIKMFTTFENETVMMLFLLWKSFQKVSFIKPGPSKSGNSEVYVVCQYFLKQKCSNDNIFISLTESAESDHMILPDLTEDLPKIFVTFLQNYTETCSCRQIDAINNNLETFNNSKNRVDMSETREYIARRFIDEFNMKKINNYVSPFAFVNGHYEYFNREEQISFKQGSFDERSNKWSDYTIQRINKMKPEKNFEEVYSSKDDSFQIKNLWKEYFLIGKQLDEVRSSSFCSSLFLSHYKIIKSNNSNQSGVDDIKDFICNEKENKIINFIGLEQDFENIAKNITDISCFRITDESESDSTIPSNTSILICKISFDVSKLKLFENIILFMKNVPYNASCILIFDSLLVTNFWCGVLFLITSLFDKMEYSLTTSGSRMALYNFKSSINIDILHKFFREAKEMLFVMDEGKDILSVIPIYTLMHSEFRKYIKYKNHYFIKCLLQDRNNR